MMKCVSVLERMKVSEVLPNGVTECSNFKKKFFITNVMSDMTFNPFFSPSFEKVRDAGRCE